MAQTYCRRKKVTTYLPSDIIFSHILPRLPLKSIPRFKCVSKDWNSFLSSRVFAKEHLSLAQKDRNQNHFKLILLSNTTPCNFLTIDCETPDDGFSAIRSLPFEASRENMSLIASVNGLVCVGITNATYKNEYSDLILWNPLTGDHKVLSRINSHKECFKINDSRGRFLFYYTSSEDDYKLLRLTESNDVYIYSLKSDCWAKAFPRRLSNGWMPCAAMNQGIYFYKQKGISESCSVMFINLTTKKFKTISLPLRNEKSNAGSRYVVSVGGQVRMYETYCAGDMLTTEWLKWPNLKGNRPKGTMLSNYPKYMSPWFLRPLHIMRNGNWLMHSENGNHLCVVDVKKQTKQFLCSYTTRYMDIQIGAKFMETLESPNQYMN